MDAFVYTITYEHSHGVDHNPHAHRVCFSFDYEKSQPEDRGSSESRDRIHESDDFVDDQPAGNDHQETKNQEANRQDLTICSF